MTPLEAALAYCRAGLAILPAHPTEKRPLAGKGQHGKNAPFPAEEQVRAQCARAEAICILCGAVSGNVECVDFDDAGSAFPAWRARMQAEHPDLYARLVIERSPSGGVHVVYRASEPVPGSHHLAADAAGKLLIETRGEGALFLCDPSPRYQLMQGGFTALPVLTPAEREAVLATARAFDVSRSAPPPRPQPAPNAPCAPAGASPYAAKALADEANKVRYAAEGSRNRSLNTAALKIGHYVASGQISEDNVYAALEQAALEAGLALAEIRSTIRSGLVAGMKEPKSPPAPQTATDVDISGILREVEVIGDVDDPEDTESPDDPGAMPEALARVPGFISELMDFTLSVSPYPSPILSFCGALVLQAHLAGRKVRDSADNRTNFYVLALANPCGGKDNPRKVNYRILTAIGLDAQVAGRFSSGEGLQDSLIAEPAMLFQSDEIDTFIQSVCKSKDGRLETAMSELLSIYTSANSVYPVRRKALTDRKTPPIVIDQPCLNLLGTSPPKQFYESLSERMLTNGLFSRMLIIEAGLRGKGREPRIIEPPERILETARWWANYRPPGNGDLRNEHPSPLVVPLSPKALDLAVDWREETERLHDVAEAKNDLMTLSVWGRANEVARKLALTHAVSANHQQPEIDRSALEWSIAFVRHLVRRQLFMAHSYAFVNDVHAGKQKIVRMLQNAPEGRLSKSQITRRTQEMRSKEREDALTDLDIAGVIQIYQVPTTGRPKDYVQLLQRKG